jgi:hypothetical protein
MITRKHKINNQHIISLLDKLSNINFLQLARNAKHKEQKYRQQFEKQFDFLTFNKELVLSSGSGRYAIAFDPSYISKAGKKTQGVNWYWSGCANQTKWGLEIGGLAAIDIDNHITFHLEAVQTLMLLTTMRKEKKPANSISILASTIPRHEVKINCTSNLMPLGLL